MSAKYVSSLFSAAFLIFVLHFAAGASYAQFSTLSPVPLATIVGYWSFDEVSGSVVNDSVGGHSGTLKNGALRKSGSECYSGGCVFFDGTNDYIDIGNFDTFNVQPDEKLMVKVRVRTNVTNKDMVMVSKSSSSVLLTTNPGWALLFTGYYSDSTGLRKTRPFFMSFDSNKNYGDSQTAFTTKYGDNTWHEFIVELDNELFKSTFTADGVIDPQNGVARYAKAAPLSISNIYRLVFGASNSGASEFYSGYLDEIAIYKTKIVPPAPSAIPSPTPKVSATAIPVSSPAGLCGQSCQSDKDCANPSTSGASVWCNPTSKICENRNCPAGSTISGSACSCRRGQTCGERCGPSVGNKLCTDGVSECGFISAPNQCAASEGSSTKQFCLPTAPKNGYSRAVCTGFPAYYLIGPSGQTGSPPLTQRDIWTACMPQGYFASPSPSIVPSPVLPTATPVPLMCISASCTSNTNPIKYGSSVSCSVSSATGANLRYEGQCTLKRNDTLIQNINLTPTLTGSPIFQPFTISHANAQLSCVFRVCTINSSNVQTCSPWGSTP